MAKRKVQKSAEAIAATRAAPRKSPPHAFVLEALAPLSPVTRQVISCLGVYLGDRIVLMLRDKPARPEDNGVWLATSPEHHDSLRHDFPNMRSLQLFGEKGTGWQLLPMDAPDFESSALHACDLIARKDPRIGKIPKSRRTKP